jgi:hypothetical protein
MILHLSRCPRSGAAGNSDVAVQIRRLGWHATSYEDGLAFPGDQLLRLSMDFATGTAGVLFAVGCAAAAQRAAHRAELPLLGPPQSSPYVGSRPAQERTCEEV